MECTSFWFYLPTFWLHNYHIFIYNNNYLPLVYHYKILATSFRYAYSGVIILVKIKLRYIIANIKRIHTMFLMALFRYHYYRECHPYRCSGHDLFSFNSERSSLRFWPMANIVEHKHYLHLMHQILAWSRIARGVRFIDPKNHEFAVMYDSTEKQSMDTPITTFKCLKLLINLNELLRFKYNNTLKDVVILHINQKNVRNFDP